MIDKLGFLSGPLAGKQLPNGQSVIDAIRLASSEAFVKGMDKALVFGGVALILAGIVSYFIVSDAVFEVKSETAPEPAHDCVRRPEHSEARAQGHWPAAWRVRLRCRIVPEALTTPL